jgi:hypothetical protein
MASGTKTRQGRSAKRVTGSKGGGRTSKRSGGGGKPGTMGNTSGMKRRGGRARSSSKRELIDTGTDKRFVRRGAGGQFKESDDVGRSLAADRRRSAKAQAHPGQGDRGDR